MSIHTPQGLTRGTWQICKIDFAARVCLISHLTDTIDSYLHSATPAPRRLHRRSDSATAAAYQIEASDLEQCPKFSQFKHLDSPTQEIRLIRMGDDIKIETHPILTAPKYHAISYYWGPPKPTQHISVQGESVEIRETVTNLFDVLRERYGDEAYFWIDILCIDQRNLEERNSQVSMMTEIFSHAFEVISWLGKSTAQSRKAFQVIEKRLCCPEEPSLQRWTECPDDPHSYDFVEANNWPTTNQLKDDSELLWSFVEIVVWPLLADVLGRRYWQRLWVVPEMIVGASCVLLCGFDASSLDDFVTVLDGWIFATQIPAELPTMRISADLDLTHSTVSSVNFRNLYAVWLPIQMIRNDFRDSFKENSIRLRDLFHGLASKECSNVRDKVFAMRSLSKATASIKVDYSMSIEEVIMSVVETGALISTDNPGMGFNALSSLIVGIGIDIETLNEGLEQLPQSVIHFKCRWIGTIVSATIHSDDPKSDVAELRKRRLYLRVVSRDRKGQRAEFFCCWTVAEVKHFIKKS